MEERHLIDPEISAAATGASRKTAHVDGPPLVGLDELQWVADIPRMWAEIDGQRVALVHAERDCALSYADLDRLSDAFADFLRQRGVGAGERVAYLGRNNDLYFAVLFGAIRGRVILVPLNWRLAAEENSYQLADCTPTLLIGDEDFTLLAEQAMASLPKRIDWLSVESRAEVVGLRQLLDEIPCPARADNRWDTDQIVALLYTSGTTGRPKGVMISHYALSVARHSELQMPGMAQLKAAAVTLSPMPNFHSGGLAWVLMGLIRGSTVVITADASPSNILALVRRYQAEHTFIVPTVLRNIVDVLKASGESAHYLKGVFYGAMPIGESLLRDAIAIIGCSFGQYFGMTENTGSATYLDPWDHDPARPHLLQSVGKPYNGMSVEIRGPDRSVCRAGEHGEIWIRSPTALKGYWNLPDKTREALVEGWYASGDGGYLDGEGYLYLTDRIKDMIVTGGENVYPAEVEEALRRHPAILDAAVIGVPDERWGEAVTGVIELRPGTFVDVTTLQAFVRCHLAGYKCPKKIVFKSPLPRTASGKVKRAELRDDFSS